MMTVLCCDKPIGMQSNCCPHAEATCCMQGSISRRKASALTNTLAAASKAGTMTQSLLDGGGSSAFESISVHECGQSSAL